MLHCERRAAIRVIGASLLMGCMLAGPAFATPARCGESNVVVDAPGKAETALACQGAQNAINFLISQGLRVPATITLRLVPQVPAEFPGTALGAYLREKQEIVLVTYRHFLTRSDMFRIPPDQDLYRAIVAHEVAHAIADHNFRVAPSLLALEYISYVTFFSTMPSSKRERLLQPYSYDAKWPLYADVLYLEDHLDFGAHAYWHFVRPENGPDFFRRLFAGDELAAN